MAGVTAALTVIVLKTMVYLASSKAAKIVQGIIANGGAAVLLAKGHQQ